jgi:DNA-binding Lrp family transcriptional regulator
LVEVAKDLRQPIVLDELDQRILDIVQRDARIPNNELAARCGIAQSTAHARLRSLEARGVIRGYESVIDQHALGLELQALIGVTLRPGARQSSIETFSNDTRALPEVIQMFFLGGADDFVVHTVVQDSSALRRFVVEHLSGHPAVASTRTNLIFDYSRNTMPASFS